MLGGPLTSGAHFYRLLSISRGIKVHLLWTGSPRRSGTSACFSVGSYFAQLRRVKLGHIQERFCCRVVLNGLSACRLGVFLGMCQSPLGGCLCRSCYFSREYLSNDIIEKACTSDRSPRDLDDDKILVCSVPPYLQRKSNE